MAAPYFIPSDKLQPKPDYTPHVTIDLEEGLVAGNAVMVNGHRFLVQAARFDTHGEIRATLHGADSISQIISELDLTLVHADWAGCPAVEEAEPIAEPEPPGALAGRWPRDEHMPTCIEGATLGEWYHRQCLEEYWAELGKSVIVPRTAAEMNHYVSWWNERAAIYRGRGARMDRERPDV